MIFVDSNIVIDAIGTDQAWTGWSRARLREVNVAGEELVINPVVVAETAGNAPDLRSLLAALDDLDLEIVPLDEASAFAAGRAFREYRRARDRAAQGGPILADFLIGAHAAGLGASLLTRDVAIYRRYFPDLPLITPETHPHG